jgi:hypothetical protein
MRDVFLLPLVCAASPFMLSADARPRLRLFLSNEWRRDDVDSPSELAAAVVAEGAELLPLVMTEQTYCVTLLMVAFGIRALSNAAETCVSTLGGNLEISNSTASDSSSATSAANANAW